MTIEAPDQLVKVYTLPCPWCEAPPKVLTVKASELDLFEHSTAFIQDCFPDMDKSDRERMKTGICGPCWDEIFTPEDEEEEV